MGNTILRRNLTVLITNCYQNANKNIFNVTIHIHFTVWKFCGFICWDVKQIKQASTQSMQAREQVKHMSIANMQDAQ